jgi:hypothetical protein
MRRADRNFLPGEIAISLRWMRSLVVLLSMLFAVAACSGDEPAADVVVAGPDDVVNAWLVAIEDVDLDALANATSPSNVALVAGAENGFSVEQMQAVVDAGLPLATSRSYWTTFHDSFTAFLGGDGSEIAVVGVEQFQIDDTEFAAVTVERRGEQSEIIAQLTPDGWTVDMLATVGPALSVQVRRLVAMIVDEGDDSAAFAYATMAVESLGAALTRQPDNRALELELEAIEDLPIDLSR